ncbi:hypothetical protein [Myroides pelagicus]|uniref:Uncharacterized protein n=1 Tax=Myroides pelagicus TaxID=270914 RepID=A0A7K1GM30_9FLAO|nr:hypothetical protein [Myroides pelagicus]MEC4114347.1 hypothetical protein [Myroides pelagicus]MTH29871.1 hypothetical protein [Myroides pelagicus]
MDKEQYLNQAKEIIFKKNFVVPFELIPGSIVTSLEQYFNSLSKAYLASKDSRLVELFHDKIEQLKHFDL